MNTRWIRRLSLPAGGEHWVLLLAVALYATQEVSISMLDPEGGLAWLRRSIFFVTTPAFVLVALHFRRYAGAWIIAVGITMNFIPMAAHGGNMPVAYETVRDSGAFSSITEDQIGEQLHNSKDVLLWRSDIRIEPLSDNIVATIPGYRTNIYSPGDVILGIGILVAAAEAIAHVFGFSWGRLFAWFGLRKGAAT